VGTPALAVREEVRGMVGHQQKKGSAFDGRPTRLEVLLCAGDDLQNHVNDQNVHDCDIRDTVLHVFTSSVELDCRPPEDMKKSSAGSGGISTEM
jgi:hypothetical protein